MIRQLIFLSWLLFSFLNADKLAVLEINPIKREILAESKVLVCYDFQNALLVRLDNKSEQTLKNYHWHYQVVDSCFVNDAYFLIAKHKHNKYQGDYLWENSQFYLIKKSEDEACSLKKQGFILRKLREYLLPQTQAYDIFDDFSYDTLVAQMLNQVSLDSLVTRLY
ncbi:MAG: hypothetical protein N2748_00650, partial [candidate division WOR-3 bacterium]|nr:hypothetical protein [candidate division WOR-3 bacterium]